MIPKCKYEMRFTYRYFVERFNNFIVPKIQVEYNSIVQQAIKEIREDDGFVHLEVQVCLK